jgi:hypothetical protein
VDTFKENTMNPENKKEKISKIIDEINALAYKIDQEISPDYFETDPNFSIILTATQTVGGQQRNIRFQFGTSDILMMTLIKLIDEQK